jgi:integrase
MRSAYIEPDAMSAALAMLTYENRTICEIMLKTGLRVGDVLLLRRENIKERMSIKEQKTGKSRRVYLGKELASRLKGSGAPGWCFPNARDNKRPRTRQAVWKDLKRAAKILRYKENLTPHSCRKTYAVNCYKNHGLEITKKNLNHDRLEVTLLYALSDTISKNQHRQKRKLKK